MNSFEISMQIEAIEADLSAGTEPKKAFYSLLQIRTYGNPLAKIFLKYLEIAGFTNPRDRSTPDQVLLNAFAASVRQVRVKKSDLGSLHLKAEMEAADAKDSLQTVVEERDLANELARTRYESRNDLQRDMEALLNDHSAQIDQLNEIIKSLRKERGTLRGQLTMARRRNT